MRPMGHFWGHFSLTFDRCVELFSQKRRGVATHRSFEISLATDQNRLEPATQNKRIYLTTGKRARDFPRNAHLHTRKSRVYDRK